MLLPEGFALPVPYVVSLAIAAALVCAVLFAARPPVTEGTILALTPWMVSGSALHVLYVVDAVSPSVAPLFGTPTVYLTTFVLAGGVWAAASGLGTSRRVDRASRRLGAVGVGLAVVAVGTALLQGVQQGTVTVLWPTAAVVVSGVVTALAWFALSLTDTSVVARTGMVGALVVFGHVLDGISTAVGIDVLGVDERSPIPRAIMEAAGTLPTADLLGTGWLFVLVKLGLALVVVGLLADYVEESPVEGYLVLGLIAAVGLGPGVHNTLLFLISG